LSDRDESVQNVALHSVSLSRDAQAEKQLCGMVAIPNAALQRVAAEAFGRIGNQDAVGALLTASSANNDRVLEHSLIYALIEIADSKETTAALGSESVFEHRAALIALDQMDKGGLSSEAVVSLLPSENPLLRKTASWVALHHPEWGDSLAA